MQHSFDSERRSLPKTCFVMLLMLQQPRSNYRVSTDIGCLLLYAWASAVFSFNLLSHAIYIRADSPPEPKFLQCAISVSIRTYKLDSSPDDGCSHHPCMRVVFTPCQFFTRVHILHQADSVQTVVQTALQYWLASGWLFAVWCHALLQAAPV